MGPVAQHALLGLAVAALAGAGLRAASLAAPSGLIRVVAAAPLAAGAAALSALGLGLVELGSSRVALALVAGALWLAARLALAAPAVPVSRELAEWWRTAPTPRRVAAGAVLGALLAWTAWLLRYPALGIDSIAYHLPEVVAWVQQGTPGSVQPIVPGLPVGNYPLTNEVLLAWGSGIARSFVFVSLWTPAMLGLLGVAGWTGLRSLGAPRPAAALAVAALVATPVLTHYGMNGANTDLPALAWLVTAAALIAGAGKRPELLAPGVLAACLAVGTKTTALPLAAVVVGAGLWWGYLRRRPRTLPLAAAAATGLATGGYWYLRNLVDHGSPFWPFVATPWSDAPPGGQGIGQGLNTSLLERPRETVERVGADWLELFGGGMVLLAGAVLVALLARDRRVTLAAGAAVGSLLVWSASPFTGYSVPTFEVATISTVRYLLPALAAAALALALATRRPGLPRAAAYALLVVAVSVGAAQAFDLGFPSVPSPLTPLAGAAAGALVAGLLSRASSRQVLPVPRIAWALVALLAGAALAIPASGYVERHATTARLFGSDALRWLVGQPGFSEGEGRIAGVPIIPGPMAGNRLQHRFEWVRGEPCARTRARAREGWVVVLLSPQASISRTPANPCLRGLRRSHIGAGFAVYGR